MEPTHVWLHSRHVGTLEPTRRGNATFRFDDELVDAFRSVPLLSTALPVRAQPFDAERTRSWFAGLLPEDRQLDEVRRRFNLQSASYLDVLREIGWECAGAVVVAPDARHPAEGSLKPLSATELAERLAALPQHPYDDNEALRISLGGFQAKLLVTRANDGWALPIGGAVSTHILKPQPVDAYPGLVEAEAWGMAVAAGATEAAKTWLLGLDGAPVTLVSERFDRSDDNGRTVRLHQEDGAQAMGVPPERKYATGPSGAKSDPSLAKIADLLDRFAEAPRVELRRLAEQVTVNVALGNTDAHAKNYGILHPTDRTVALSPMYDVVPARVINPGMLEMGLRIDAALRIDRVTGAKLVAEAASWGISARVARSYVEQALAKLRIAVDEVGELYSAADPRLATTTAQTIDHLLHTL